MVSAKYKCYECSYYKFEGVDDYEFGDRECETGEDTIDDAGKESCSKGCIKAEIQFDLVDNIGDTYTVEQYVRGCADNKRDQCRDADDAISNSDLAAFELLAGFVFDAVAPTTSIAIDYDDGTVCECQADYCNAARDVTAPLLATLLTALASLLFRC